MEFALKESVLDKVAYRYNLFNNFFIACFFFFLPFNYALTFNFGFPLKISEFTSFLIIGFSLLYFLVFLRISIAGINENCTRVLIAFVIISSVTTLIHLNWNYPYPQKIYDARMSYQLDSLFKLFYLILDFAVMIIAVNGFRANRLKYTNLLIAGAVVAAIYTWYLSIGSFLKLDVYLLPGMDIIPQTLKITDKIRLIRCGTFKEGNYMGVFLMTAAIISFFEKRPKIGYFLFFSILPTFSTIAFFGSLIFYILLILKKYLKIKYLLHFAVILFTLYGAIDFAMQYRTFRFFTIDKVSADEENFSHSSYSKIDRLNSIKVAYNLGMDNKWLGIGLSNYSRHYDEYNSHRFFTYENEKPIPNNVYLEVFCETGIIGSFFFLLFIWFLFRATKRDESGCLRFGLISMLLCFNAFPTFSVLFIWVFFGLILSLPKRKG